MPIRIERIEAIPGSVPEGTLGFGPDGWRTNMLDEVVVECRGTDIWHVLDLVDQHHRGLLGPGDLVFLLKSEESHKRTVRGFIVFLPDDVASHSFGIGVDTVLGVARS